MKKINEKTVEKANKVLRVIIALFVLLSIYIWISTATPWKRVKAENSKQTVSNADSRMENGMETGLEDQGERQTYAAIKGFKVIVKNRKGSSQADTDEQSGDEEDTADPNEFAFPNSYKEKLTEADVRSLTTTKEVQDAINYIYARTGCMFRDEEKRAYYEQFDWYEGRYYVDEMNENPLNYMTELQHENIELLANRRDELNE